MPVTLTKQQFLQRKPGGSYPAYKAYIAKNRPKRIAARQNAYTSYDPTQQGPVPSFIQQEARQTVQSQVDPIVAEITRSIGQQAKAGQQAIGGYTSTLADALGGYQGNVDQVYGRAQQSQAAVDAALRQSLAGGGGMLADTLAQKLAQAGQDTAPADTVRQTGEGAANASLATGSANLGELLAQGAAASTYAAGLPDIARLGGLQASRNLGAQSQAQLADSLGTITSQVPSLIRQTQQDLVNQALQKWLAVHGFQTDTANTAASIYNTNADAAAAAASEAGRTNRAKATAAAAAKTANQAASQKALAAGVKLATSLRAGSSSSGGGGGGGGALTPGAPTGGGAGQTELVDATRQVLALVAGMTPTLSAAQRAAIVRQALTAAGYKVPAKVKPNTYATTPANARGD